VTEAYCLRIRTLRDSDSGAGDAASEEDDFVTFDLKSLGCYIFDGFRALGYVERLVTRSTEKVMMVRSLRYFVPECSTRKLDLH